MEPSSKRRRLAPKLPESSGHSGALPQPSPSLPPPPSSSQTAPNDQQPSHAHYASQDPAPLPERHDFEAFARHLQDAAMYIYRQAQKSQYASVSVLMLRWDDDTSAEDDLILLDKVLAQTYNYGTERWRIPTVPNPSIKLGVQIASFLENARPDHLLIIYYAGHGYVGPDNQLYWACNARDDAAKLKWDGVRCLIEDAQADMLLLLDSCALKDTTASGSHGLKQVIAAYSPDQRQGEPGSRSFTAALAESLERLASGRPFSLQKLYDEILAQGQQGVSSSESKLTNGPVSKSGPATQEGRTPVFFTLTPTNGRTVSLVPLSATGTQQSTLQPVESDVQNTRTAQGDQYDIATTGAGVDITFDEARVLVCTTFVGDATPDMAFFNQWLHSTPPTASNVTVEGMFLGPPTMLLISMPHSIWNVVQHDKVCCFLGYISSHNMIHLYQRLVGSAGLGVTISKEVEDGRILLEAREAAASSTTLTRRDHADRYSGIPAGSMTNKPSHGRERDLADASQQIASLPHASPNAPAFLHAKDEVEDSAEMQEAAEQLKALSHVRPLSGGSPSTQDRRKSQMRDNIEVRREGAGSSPEADESAPEEGYHDGGQGTPSSRGKSRRPPKQIVKQETRCHHCSHAPFKDSSSLRKHIAAAHTRPFPCAFSFAGCTSTFGSKNEWKRHIASQHLCLQYYRCSACPPSSAEGKGNEFNRKDLFTQHLRRMHAPFAIKKSIAKGDSKLHSDWELHVREMQQSCLVTRRQPPQRSACPKPDCQSVFEGPGSWDEWTEHVGRHMEKGEAQRLGVDRLLAKYALDEGIVERKDSGEYKLCGWLGSSGADRDLTSASFVSDSRKAVVVDEDPSITVAVPVVEVETINVEG
ncbi:hypothetical protein GQ53DRAFT_800623 [Thozetella sp. PMI_491]|nr:hypothetical protein GQ53DRAFT_800623 [Thozetella sp. PMI_491]